MTKLEMMKQVQKLLQSFEEAYQENPHDFEFMDAMDVIWKCLVLLNQEALS